jgi:hypothetical protein
MHNYVRFSARVKLFDHLILDVRRVVESKQLTFYFYSNNYIHIIMVYCCNDHQETCSRILTMQAANFNFE